MNWFWQVYTTDIMIVPGVDYYRKLEIHMVGYRVYQASGGEAIHSSFSDMRATTPRGVASALAASNALSFP